MRPSAETALASVKIRAAPPTAREPRWTRCQSLAKPSVLEYWHIGETTMRLRSFRSRIWSGSKTFIGESPWQIRRRVSRCADNFPPMAIGCDEWTKGAGVGTKAWKIKIEDTESA